VTADRYEAQAAAAMQAVEARPPDALLWFGRRIAAFELTGAIRARLLEDFSATGVPRPSRRAQVAPGNDGGEFARALSQANGGRGCWQPGWRVAGAGAGNDDESLTVVRPDGLRLLAPAEDCRVAGAHADVRLPKELTGFVPGLHIALGDTPAPEPARALVRLCWTIAATGAAALVARVSYVLNGAGVPFSLQLRADPRRYADPGAAGLLLARTDFAAAMKLVRPLLRTLGPHLADGAPAFAKPLTRGLAVAEEPPGAEGFAAHRCGLLADAVVAAGERGLREPAQRLALVRERFAAAGLRLDAPYLQPGSADAYELS
jgi:hypothetical protein